MGKSGLQREMDSFFKETEDADFNIRRVTKSTFTQARKYLSPEAFLELNDVIVGNFYQNAAFLGYKNHRLLAVDGGFLNLPDHPSIREEFGRRAFGRGTKKDVPKSMALISLLYDPANYMTLDVQTGHTDGSELQLLLKHLTKAEKGDILLLDRGYPGILCNNFCTSEKDDCTDNFRTRFVASINNFLTDRYSSIAKSRAFRNDSFSQDSRLNDSINPRVQYCFDLSASTLRPLNISRCHILFLHLV